MLEVKEVQKRYGTFELECSLTILDDKTELESQLFLKPFWI